MFCIRNVRNIEDLIQKDKLVNERKSLKGLIEEMEDEVLANAGVDVFEEVFKLIYTKLYDEMEGGRNHSRALEFRNYGDTDEDLKSNIGNLFERAKDKWPGVFSADAKISLTPSHLAICVSSLQDVKLFNSNLDVIDDAFEYLMSKSQKGEKGQYFTPRYVIDMCVRMLNPNKYEKMIDPAAGSCGFPVHTVFYVWKKILKEQGIEQSHLFTAEKKPPECEDYVNKNVFAIDFDEKTVRVARTLNLIAGDGKTNVLHLNTLDYERWNDVIDTEAWRDSYYDGWKGLRSLRANKTENRDFNFDIVMANPPFAGDIKESRIIAKYELGKNAKGKYQSKVGRDILFIERNLSFLKPGGRMAIVLPQGRFNNSSDKYIRDFIMEKCRILAVVGLHGNVFKPHTGTKTSVLFVQKWDDELCPKKDDYPIFFATMQKPSKDNSGDKIFRKDEEGNPKLDNNGHMIVEHDLFNHDGLTEDGIAEAFIEFAKREGLSFFADARPFNEEKYNALMDGLECSEVWVSSLNRETRLDAEYFSKKAICLYNVIKDRSHFNVGNIAYVTDGIHESINYDINSKIHLISATSPRCNYFDLSREAFISEETHLLNPRTALRIGDVILSTVGTIGNCAVVTDEILPANSDRHVAIIRLGNKLLPNVLSCFLLSKYGRNQTHREATGNVQPNLFIYKIKDLIVPSFSPEFNNYVDNIALKAQLSRKKADKLYIATEQLLQNELKLDLLPVSTQNTTTKSLSEVFKTGRLDAEYFMPKYDDLFDILNKLPIKALGNIVNIVKSIEPGSDFYSDEGIPFIRVSDVSRTKINTPSIKLPMNFMPDIQALYPHRDTILFSKDGSIGIAYKVEQDMEAITSGALLHLVVKNKSEVLPDYLTLVLNSQAVQLQANRDSNGAIIQHWRIDDIKKVIIPILPLATQEIIASQVQESFALRKRSEELIKVAIRAVEIAIEQNEEAAIAYVDENANHQMY